MINSKSDLHDFLTYEKDLYINGGFVTKIKLKFLHDSEYLIWHYVKMLRMTEYHLNTGHKIRYWFYQRRKNIEGRKLGISIYQNCIDKGLRIYHYGSIIINSHAKIGRNCKLHGNNCIGNKGEKYKYQVPIIGDNFDLGIGAQVIGPIEIGDNIVVGANAVVVHSFLENDLLLVGIPAKTKSLQDGNL